MKLLSCSLLIGALLVVAATAHLPEPSWPPNLASSTFPSCLPSPSTLVCPVCPVRPLKPTTPQPDLELFKAYSRIEHLVQQVKSLEEQLAAVDTSSGNGNGNCNVTQEINIDKRSAQGFEIMDLKKRLALSEQKRADCDAVQRVNIDTSDLLAPQPKESQDCHKELDSCRAGVVYWERMAYEANNSGTPSPNTGAESALQRLLDTCNTTLVSTQSQLTDARSQTWTQSGTTAQFQNDNASLKEDKDICNKNLNSTQVKLTVALAQDNAAEELQKDRDSLKKDKECCEKDLQKAKDELKTTTKDQAQKCADAEKEKKLRETCEKDLKDQSKKGTDTGKEKKLKDTCEKDLKALKDLQRSWKDVANEQIEAYVYSSTPRPAREGLTR